MKQKQKLQERIDLLRVRAQNIFSGYSDEQIHEFTEAANQLEKQLDKKESPSEAQKVLGKGKLLLERPFGMNFAVYRFMRSYQNKVLKKLFPSPPNVEISRVMRPRIDSLHLQNQVLDARERERIDALRESHPDGDTWFSKLFNWLRSRVNVDTKGYSAAF